MLTIPVNWACHYWFQPNIEDAVAAGPTPDNLHTCRPGPVDNNTRPKYSSCAVA